MTSVMGGAYEHPVFASTLSERQSGQQHTRDGVRGTPRLPESHVYAVLGGGERVVYPHTNEQGACSAPDNSNVYALLAPRGTPSWHAPPHIGSAVEDNTEGAGGSESPTQTVTRTTVRRSLSAPPPPRHGADIEATPIYTTPTTSHTTSDGQHADEETFTGGRDARAHVVTSRVNARSFPSPPCRRTPADPLPPLPSVEPGDNGGASTTVAHATRFYSASGPPSPHSQRAALAVDREHSCDLSPSIRTRSAGAVVGSAIKRFEWFHGPISRVEAEQRLSQAGLDRAGRLGSARGFLRPYAEGMFLVRSRPDDSSCVLSVMAGADCAPSGLRVWHFRVAASARGGGITVDTQDGRVHLPTLSDVADLVTALQKPVDPLSKLALITRRCSVEGALCRMPCAVSSFTRPASPPSTRPGCVSA